IGMGVLSGAADEPERIREEAFETLGRARREGLDRAAFARAKKGQLSDLVRTFNSVEEAGELSLDCVLDGYDFIDYADALRALTPEDAERVLCDIFDPAASALAVIGRK
ncbi:MAG: insulinase family protein, partial [Clostridia bacterium]|nr:insulinase family protein [Clostridia bacterium]